MIRKAAFAVFVLVAFAIGLPPLWYSVFQESLPDLPPPGHRVEVSPGVRVNVLEQGKGPPVVLVHGHPGYAYDWAPVMTQLAQRGFGLRPRRLRTFGRTGQRQVYRRLEC